MKKPAVIGEKIKLARLNIGLSQKQLARAVKLSDKAISAYEVGRAIPSLSMLKEISGAVDKPVTYFLNDLPAEEIDLADKLTRIGRELREVKELLQRRTGGG